MFLLFRVKYRPTYMYTPTIYEGEHPGQQGPASMYRRLRSVNNHWRRNSHDCRGLSGIVDFERHTYVVYWWGDPPLDES